MLPSRFMKASLSPFQRNYARNEAETLTSLHGNSSLDETPDTTIGNIRTQSITKR